MKPLGILLGLGALVLPPSVTAQDEHVPKERVVVLRVNADGSAAHLADQLEDSLADAVKKSERVSVNEQVPPDQAAPPHPETEAEARTIAEIHGSQFLIAGRVSPAKDVDRVQVELRVESVEHERYDTVRFEVYPSRLDDAVTALVPLALRDHGLGSEGVALTQKISAGEGIWAQDGTGQSAAEQEQPTEKPASPEPTTTEPALEQEPQPEAPSALSETGPLALGAGLAVRPLLRSAGDGGVLIGPVVQGRYRLAEGFGVHANAGLMWGAASALELSVGAAFLPLRVDGANLLLGASAELGAYFSFSGSRDPALLVRVSPTLFVALSKQLGLDVGVLEFGWISGANALTLGGHARVRYSF